MPNTSSNGTSTNALFNTNSDLSCDPNKTVGSLLQVANGNAGLTTTLQNVYDGNGTACPLQMNSSGINVTGFQQFNVKTYGAIGNGVADDTTAIQNALNAAHTAGGGEVIFPQGTYIVNTRLLFYSNTVISGQGWGTVIKAGASMSITYGPVLTNASTANGNGFITSNILIRDLKIDGNGSVLGVGAGDEGSQAGIRIDESSQIMIRNVWIYNTVGDGAYIVNSPVNSVIDGCRFDTCGNVAGQGHRGLVFGITPINTTIINSYFTNNQQQGLLFQAEGGGNASGLVISNNIFDSNHGRAIDIGDNTVSGIVTQNIYIEQVTITGNVITNNGDIGIRLTQIPANNGHGAHTVTDGVTISGNYIAANNGDGIQLNAANNSQILRVNIIGNSLASNSGYGINIDHANVNSTKVYSNLYYNNTSGTLNNSGTNTDADTSLVTLTGTQILSNKTLIANTLVVADNADNTKGVGWDVSASSAGTSTVLQFSQTVNRTINFPNVSDTLLGKATVDTLTNKTYDTAGTGNVFKINGNQISAVSGSASAVPTIVTATSFSPGYTGFVANPTAVAFYTLVGKLCFIFLDTATTPGTSNATSFTITGLPFTSLRAYTGLCSYAVDNGAGTSAQFQISASSSTVTFTKSIGSIGGGGWTNSGNKGATLIFWYETT